MDRFFQKKTRLFEIRQYYINSNDVMFALDLYEDYIMFTWIYMKIIQCLCEITGRVEDKYINTFMMSKKNE